MPMSSPWSDMLEGVTGTGFQRLRSAMTSVEPRTSTMTIVSRARRIRRRATRPARASRDTRRARCRRDSMPARAPSDRCRTRAPAPAAHACFASDVRATTPATRQDAGNDRAGPRTRRRAVLPVRRRERDGRRASRKNVPVRSSATISPPAMIHQIQYGRHVPPLNVDRTSTGEG